MGNPDKIVAVGLGEVLYDHDVVTDEYTFGGAPANFADHFLKCSRLISGPDAAEVHVVSAVGDDERGRAVSAELEARGLCDGLCRVGELPTGVVDKRRDASITPDFMPNAMGSCLIEWGRTRVLCTATVQNALPLFLQDSKRGWLTAEYSMLPGSTPTRFCPAHGMQ